MRNNEQLNPTVARSVWQDFLLFLKDPHAAGATIYRWGTLGLFAVPLLLNILCVLLKGWITQGPMINASDLVALTPEKLLLFILLYPLIEELGFRGFLLFHKKKYVVIAALPILALLDSLGKKLVRRAAVVALSVDAIGGAVARIDVGKQESPRLDAGLDWPT